MAKKTSKKSMVEELVEAAQAELAKEEKGKKKGKKKEATIVDTKKPVKEATEIETPKLWADIVKRKNEDGDRYYFIKNLKDLPKDIQKGLKAFHKKEVSDESTKNLKRALKALGVATGDKVGKTVMPERTKRQAPPKFEPRRFEIGTQKLVELGRNHEPKSGDMYVILIDQEGGKKPRKPKAMVTYLLYSGNKVVYTLIPSSEDAIVGLPEMLKKREIWSIDPETKETITGKDSMHGLFIPVKEDKAEKNKAVNE